MPPKRKVKSPIKRGPLSAEEKRTIEKLSESRSDEDIAAQLKRPVATVQQCRLQYQTNNPHLSIKKTEHQQLRDDLHLHYQWDNFKKEYTEDELIMFENCYVDLMSQFKSDIMATEMKQIFQAINLEILMHRHSCERMQVQKDINRLERVLQAEYDVKDVVDLSKQDRDRIFSMETQLNSMRASTQAKMKELKDMYDRFSTTLNELKATRTQRIQKIENSKISWIGLLKELQEEEVRERLGVDMLIMNEGVKKEYERLSNLHEYANGEVDLPLLNAETITRIEEV